jgi:hypothetical protein
VAGLVLGVEEQRGDVFLAVVLEGVAELGQRGRARVVLAEPVARLKVPNLVHHGRAPRG